ncbi:DUF3325 domain-containing protein [Comamonas testosteroni]|uniref:DUF3325 domain-containing protein n=1 Tax=Comamonas testosteroni TaxID=285 RepID=UPI002DB838EB|nr:DUF3325 domain-containing protein [Comamonas testosteroni]MEB5964660.1 DUF3325 domain-containing protein [Comamonas testosteroni]
MLLDFLMCFAAWTALALAMDRHHEDAWPGEESEAPAAVLLRLRLFKSGWALLSLSLGMALCFPAATTVAMSATVWTAALCLSALATTALATWQAQRLPVLGQAALGLALMVFCFSRLGH